MSEHTKEPWSVAEEAFDNDGIHETVVRGLDGRAALVAAAEREACARACQAVIDGGIYDGSQQYAAAACRNGILARGEKGQS